MRRRIKGILMSGKQFSLDSHLDLFQGVEQKSSKVRPNSEPDDLQSAEEPLIEHQEHEENGKQN